MSHTEQWGYTRVQVTEESMTVQFIIDAVNEIYDEAILYPWPESDDKLERKAQIARDIGIPDADWMT